MPKKDKEIREIKEIMEDAALTEEEWRQEMTESYKAQYMKQPHIVKMEEQLSTIRENIQAAVQSKEADPKLVSDLAKELERVTNKKAEEEKKIDETVANLVQEDREKRTEFAKSPIVVTEEQLKDLEDALNDDEKQKTEPEAVKENAVLPKKESKEEPKKDPKKETEPAKTKAEIENEIETLRNDADLPQTEWNEKMHRASAQWQYLEKREDFEKQDKKTQDLTERIQKMQKEYKEGDDRKPLEELEKELDDHQKQVIKDRSETAWQTESMYLDELYKRKEHTLKDKQRKLRKENKTREADDVQKEMDQADQELATTNQYIEKLSKEKETPKSNLAESAFMEKFSAWMPESIYPTGPDRLTDLFKSVEQKKEKMSEEILKADKAADLNFDGVDQEAKKQGDRLEQAGHMSAPKGFTGLSMTDLNAVPHKDVDIPEKEIQKEQVQQAGGKPRKFTGTNQVVKASEVKLNVPHAEIPEQKEEIQNTAEQTQPVPKEEPKPETKQPEEVPKAQETEEISNVMKAFKLLELFKNMKDHDSAVHINSGRYDAMKGSMEKLESVMGDSFGDAFGTLMRDFGNISSFQDLCKKGGPVDLAVGQALDEVEKKCEAYVQEKTNHLTKTHMGSGLGNARIKDAMDALSICNPERAKELGKHISIDVVDGKASKRINYNELNEMEREQEMKEMDEAKKARKQIVGEKKKEKELLDRDPVMSKEEKSKRQGLHL